MHQRRDRYLLHLWWYLLSQNLVIASMQGCMEWLKAHQIPQQTPATLEAQLEKAMIPLLHSNCQPIIIIIIICEGQGHLCLRKQSH